MKDSLKNPNLAVERSQENTNMFAEFNDALGKVMKIAAKSWGFGLGFCRKEQKNQGTPWNCYYKRRSRYGF